jgi:hypothetical protein
MTEADTLVSRLTGLDDYFFIIIIGGAGPSP